MRWKLKINTFTETPSCFLFIWVVHVSCFQFCVSCRTVNLLDFALENGTRKGGVGSFPLGEILQSIMFREECNYFHNNRRQSSPRCCLHCTLWVRPSLRALFSVSLDTSHHCACHSVRRMSVFPKHPETTSLGGGHPLEKSHHALLSLSHRPEESRGPEGQGSS